MDINYVVYSLVHDYFYTFRYCWTVTHVSLTNMIDSYIDYLQDMTNMLTEWPNNLIFATTAVVLVEIIV